MKIYPQRQPITFNSLVCYIPLEILSIYFNKNKAQFGGCVNIPYLLLLALDLPFRLQKLSHCLLSLTKINCPKG